MYLSRIELDTSKKQTQLALVCRNKFHGAIQDSFNHAKDDRVRTLWRLDKFNGKTYLLLLSPQKPDLSNFMKQFGNSSSTYETKDYDVLLNKINDDTTWQFRLIANPTKCIKTESGRGKRIAHKTTEHQMKWLIEQAEKHGFEISNDNLQVMESTWLSFSKRNERMIRALAVTYEGILKINDVEIFKATLIEGLGREKAYGMGLLTIMRI